MRFILTALLIFTVLVVAQAGQIASFISSLLAEQPSEIRSQLSTAFDRFTTITVTDSSILSSISSEVSEAINNAASDLSSVVSSVQSSLSSITTIGNAASTTSGSSVFAVSAAFILSIILFQAF